MNQNDLDSVFEQKHSLRSKVRKQLKNMDPIQRLEEDNAIQKLVLESPWFEASKSLCAYISCTALREVDTSKIVAEALSSSVREGSAQIRKKLYVPRVEDMNSNMRMLKISRVDDLVKNSMNILEPEFVDCDGNQREDGIIDGNFLCSYVLSSYSFHEDILGAVMQTSEPVDLLILPGLAFDKCGNRLGRSGGYYDLFVKKYRELANIKDWKQPLLVALSYSVQLLDEGVIPVTPFDVPVDAVVTPHGCIPTSSVASTRLS
ncbi:hypothetical protein ACFE04_022539 [Oxalis oulophora]